MVMQAFTIITISIYRSMKYAAVKKPTSKFIKQHTPATVLRPRRQKDYWSFELSLVRNDTQELRGDLRMVPLSRFIPSVASSCEAKSTSHSPDARPSLLKWMTTLTGVSPLKYYNTMAGSAAFH